MIAEKKAANAMGGKTARACDGCLRKRARWYCAADDAFLCQGCDTSVHSANQLASRHERVLLETASSKTNGSLKTEDAPPAWHQGFTRKARTPRHNKTMVVQQHKDEEKVLCSALPVVPEIGSEEEGSMLADDKEQLLYRVPVFDPFAAELCDMVTSEGADTLIETEDGNMVVDECKEQEGECNFGNLPGFLPSDVDLAEFAADVESLLGAGLDDDSCDIKESGLLDCKEEDDVNFVFGEKIVKVKDEQETEAVAGCHLASAFDMARETLNWNFDYESPTIGEGEEEEKAVPVGKATMKSNESKVVMKRNICLRLNYEAVINAWASQGCPWTTGSRPDFNPDDCWPDCMGTCPTDVRHPYGGLGGHAAGSDGGREARVSRYREKRRTRLFSKKIRYEVRKLNAEKRPRMKGRFVKRTSFVGTAAFPFLNK